MKKWLIYLLCISFLLVLPFSATAVSPKVIDEAGLLSDAEEAALERKALQLADTYQMDVVILTVWSLDGHSPEAYADNYFDDNGYGIGEDHNGILFLLSMEYRDWWMSTSGDAIYAVTDYGIQSIFEEIAWDLSNGWYYSAFDTYLNELSHYFAAFQQGSPVDGYKNPYEGPGTYQPGTQDDVVYYEKETDFLFPTVISLLIGSAVGGVGLLTMRGQMNTITPQTGAHSYLQKETYHLYQQQDVFLYQNVSRVRRAEPSSGGGGGSRGGGSRVHRSSSGRRHGGGGGKF